MGAEIFKLMGTIGVDNKQANKAIDETTGKAKGAEGKMGKAFGSMKKGAMLLGGGMVVAATGAVALAKKSADVGDNIHKASKKVGVSTTAYQELDYWAGQNGMSQGDMEKAVGRLNQRMGAAADGNEKYSGALTKLGINMDDVRAGTLSTEDAFTQSISSLSGMENGQEKAALATELFGTKLAREMLPALEDGSLSIEDAKKKAQEMGIVMSEDAVNGAADMTDMMDNASRSFGAIGLQIGVKVMPILLRLLTWITSNMPAIQRVVGSVFSAISNVFDKVADVVSKNLLPPLNKLRDWFVDKSPAIKKIVKTVFEGMGDVFKSIADKADILIPILAGLVTGFVAFNIITGIASTLKVLKGAMTGFTIATKLQTIAQGALNVVMNLNPFALVAIAIGTLVTAGILLYKNWDTVKEHAVKFWNRIKEMKDKVVKYFTELKNKSIEKVVEMKDKTIKWVKDLKDKSVAKVIEMRNDVVTWFTNLKNKAIELVKELVRRNIQFYGNLVTGVITKVKEMYTSVVKWFTDLKEKALEKVNQLKKNAVDRVTEMKNNVVTGVKGMKTGVVNWFNDMKEKTIQKAKDMVDYIKKMPGLMAKGFRAGRNALKDAFVSVFNTVLRAVGKPINGIIKGANWVLSKFNAPKINLWDVPQYAKGTDGHLGGPALVNDQKGNTYREMIQTPDGETFIPKGRNVLFPNMPKGTAVLPAMETKRVMAYKKGVGIIDGLKNIGSKAWTGLKKGAGAIWDFAKKPLDLVSNVIQDYVSLKGITKAPLDMAKGIVSKGKDAMVGWVKSLFKKHENPADASGGPGGMGSSLMGGIGFGGMRKTSPFGMRRHPIFGVGRMHTGVDLAAPSGTNVFAQHGGRVISSGWAGGFGKMVKIGQGVMEQLYAHLSQNIARTGTTVKRGQLIGKVGSTGNSTGPHLHYEVRRNGRPVHPGYENGGWINKDHLARIGEGDKLEAVIPMTKPTIAKSMVNQASDMLGMNGSEEILEALGLILQAIREGYIINIDGRNVFNAMSPHMAMAVKGRR